MLENGILGMLGVGIAMAILWRVFTRWRKKSILLFFFFLLVLMTVESPFRTTNVLYTISFVLTLFSAPPINKPPLGQREEY
jgi:O-antigen ligase